LWISITGMWRRKIGDLGGLKGRDYFLTSLTEIGKRVVFSPNYRDAVPFNRNLAFGFATHFFSFNSSFVLLKSENKTSCCFA
jgi:hypothetical protein